MATGEAICETFKLIKNNPASTLVEIDLPKSTLIDCCFSLPVLAKETGGDNFTNDQSSVLYFYDNGFTGAVLNLQAFDGSDWVQIAVLSDDTLGTLFDFGFAENDEDERLLGFVIDWQKVLSAHGEGSYRIQTEETPIIGDIVNRYSLEWCLKKYTDIRANKTVRIDFYQSGIIGDKTSDQKIRDYGFLPSGVAVNWFNQIRLPDAIFGDDSGEYNRDFTRYKNGAEVWIKDEQVEKYQFISGYYPNYVHKFMRVDVLQADDIEITTYFNNGNSDHQNKSVIPSGNYDPNWNHVSKLASVELSFEQKYQNYKHKRC